LYSFNIHRKSLWTVNEAVRVGEEQDLEIGTSRVPVDSVQLPRSAPQCFHCIPGPTVSRASKPA